MAFSFRKLISSLPFSGLLRNLENDVETVIKVLQPGPLGIIEHKSSAEGIVKRAVDNWRRNAKSEQYNPFLKDFISK